MGAGPLSWAARVDEALKSLAGFLERKAGWKPTGKKNKKRESKVISREEGAERNAIKRI